MRPALALVVATLCVTSVAHAQAPGKFPPDSLVNVKVFPKGTPVMQVVGTMRNITGALGVRCTYCHEGNDTTPLAQVNFASDAKRTKLAAREMMKMVQEVNRRLDSLPGRPTPAVTVGCATCHRGVARPVALSNLVADVATTAGADSALRAYKSLRERYYGRDAYDFSEVSLNTAALRVARAGKHDDALALLKQNEELFPQGTGTLVARGNVLLMRADTTGATAAFREAVKRDPRNGEARNRLRDIGQQP